MQDRDKINILGTEYTLIISNDYKNPKLSGSGYIEVYSKEIVLKDIVEDENTVKDLDKFKNKVLRHEIIHAFIHESGLDLDISTEETIADWISIQMPKMMKAMQESGCL